MSQRNRLHIRQTVLDVPQRNGAVHGNGSIRSEHNKYDTKWPIFGVPLARVTAWLVILGGIAYFVLYNAHEYDDRREARITNDHMMRQFCKVLETDWNADSDKMPPVSIIDAKVKRMSKFTKYLGAGALERTTWSSPTGALFTVLQHEDDLPSTHEDTDSDEAEHANNLLLIIELARESLRLSNNSRCVDLPDMSDEPRVDARKVRFYAVSNTATVVGMHGGARTYELYGSLQYDASKKRWRLQSAKMRWRQ